MTAAVIPSARRSRGPFEPPEPDPAASSRRAGPECLGAARFPVATGPIVTDPSGPRHADAPTRIRHRNTALTCANAHPRPVRRTRSPISLPTPATPTYGYHYI